MKKTNLIKTPKERITLDECVRTETGEPALKVKKSNKDMYETISMSQLIELMVLMSNQNKAVNPNMSFRITKKYSSTIELNQDELSRHEYFQNF